MNQSGNSLAQDWLRRLRLVEAELKARPEAAFAWHARIEAKVLRFLLARYPDGAAGHSGACETFVSPLAFIASDKVRPIKRERMKLLRHLARENAMARSVPLDYWAAYTKELDSILEEQVAQTREERDRNKRQREREARYRQRQRDFASRAVNQKW